MHQQNQHFVTIGRRPNFEVVLRFIEKGRFWVWFGLFWPSTDQYLSNKPNDPNRQNRRSYYKSPVVTKTGYFSLLSVTVYHLAILKMNSSFKENKLKSAEETWKKWGILDNLFGQDIEEPKNRPIGGEHSQQRSDFFEISRKSFEMPKISIFHTSNVFQRIYTNWCGAV